MRSSISARLQKAVSLFFAATLCCGLIPTAAFAAPNSLSLIPEGEQGAASIVSGAEGGDADVLALRSAEDASPVDGGGAASTSENAIDNESVDESNLSIPAASSRINETMTLQTRTVAQAESTRSYFLAQTLESTRTVPIVSANLPLDTGNNESNEASQDEEGDDGEDDPEGDDSVGASFSLRTDDDQADSGSNGIAMESTVIGSFTYRGITYAVEPGGETVAVVAADYNQLPEAFIENQVIVLPSMATADGLDYYTVSRIADYSFSTITRESVGASLYACANGEDGIEDNAITEDGSTENPEGEDASIGITAITIPASITSIGEDAFTGCDTLQYLIVSDYNPVYSMYDGALYNADQTELLYIPEARTGSLYIAPDTTTIDPELFSQRTIDTLIADPDSTAYQLLEGDSLYNANRNAINITAEDSSRVTVNREDYEILIEELVSEETPSFSLETRDIDLASASPMNLSGPFTLAELGLSMYSGQGATFAAGKSEIVTEWYSTCLDSSSYMYIQPEGAKNGHTPGNPSSTFLSKVISGYAYYNPANQVVHIQKDAKANPASSYSSLALNSTKPTNGRTYIGNVKTANTEKAGPVSNRSFRSLGKDEAIVIGSDYFATYFVDSSKGNYLDWPWAYGGSVAASPQPKDESRVFIGWFDTKQTSEDPYAEGSYICGGVGDAYGTVVSNIPDLDCNVDFYAHYGVAEHDVVFDANRGAHPDSEIETPVVWVKYNAAMPSEIKTTKVPNPSSDPYVKPYNPLSQNYESAANASGISLRDVVAKHGDRLGYEFNGYWTTRYTEDTSKTELIDGRAVTPHQYYDANMNPIGNWEETSPQATKLYAHWKYKITLDLNTYNSDGDIVLNEDGTGFGASLSGYTEGTINVPTKNGGAGITSVTSYTFTAIDGAPIQLPSVTNRKGYSPTQEWGTSRGDKGAASNIIALTSGVSAAYPAIGTPTDYDEGVTLYANWSGKANKYTVNLVFSHPGFTSTTGTIELKNQEYDKPLSGFDADTLVNAEATAGDDTLVYQGFYAQAYGKYSSHDTAHPLNTGSARQTWYIDADGTAARAFREAPASGTTVTLYALWGYPEVEIKFDMQDATLTGTLGWSGLADKGNGIYSQTLITNDAMPDASALVARHGNARTGFTFNGFWTHPYKETGTDTAKYYNADGTCTYSNGTWDKTRGVTLYAHWKYTVRLDMNAINSSGELVLNGAEDDYDAHLSSTHGMLVDRAFRIDLPVQGSSSSSATLKAYEFEAIDGEPIVLPKVQGRPGYDDTSVWGTEAAAKGDATGTTFNAGTSAAFRPALKKVSAYVNGVEVPNAYAFVLYADWAPADANGNPISLAKKYTVKLKATYPTADDAFAVANASLAEQTVTATYDQPLDTTKFVAYKNGEAFNYVDATKDSSGASRNLVLKGFYAQPCAVSGAGEGNTAYVTVGSDDAFVTLPFREVYAQGATEIPLYALWVYNTTDIVFDLQGGTLGGQTAAQLGADKLTIKDVVSHAATPVLANELAAAPERTGYRFAGWWNTPYNEGVAVTDASGVTITPKRYYGDGTPADVSVNIPTWEEFGTTTLYAHWTYTIEFDDNPTGPSGGSASILHKEPKLPGAVSADKAYQTDQFGNRYYYEDYASNKLDVVKVTALLGAPVKLPYASMRKTADGKIAGYDDTCQWRTAREASTAAPILPVDEGGFTLNGTELGKPAVTPDESGIVTLHADWSNKAHKYVVTLMAGEGALASLDGKTAWSHADLVGVTYDKTLSEAGIGALTAPLRNGYTFTGFYTQEEGATEEGTRYISASGEPTGAPWAETATAGEDGVRHVTLYAHYVADAYHVTYETALPDEGDELRASKTPGSQLVDGTEPVSYVAWSYGDTCFYEQKGAALPTPANTANAFSRNGYDFLGWYWIDDTAQSGPVAIDASYSDGTPRGAFTPSLAWQKEHKGALNADGTVQAGEIVLYAAWAPKRYALRIDMGYKEQANKAYPDASMAGMTKPNVVVSRDGALCYEVEYEGDLTPFFEMVEGTAQAKMPTDEPYEFSGWRVSSNINGKGQLLFGRETDGQDVLATHGKFMPDYPLSNYTYDSGIITYAGQWNDPKAVAVHLSAGTDETLRGSFAADKIAKIDSALEPVASTSEIVLGHVDYGRVFDLMDPASAFRPQPEAGYTFVGYLKTTPNYETVYADGTNLLEGGPYDANGELKSSVRPFTSLSKLTRDDVWAVAVYSRNRMTVELDMYDMGLRDEEGNVTTLSPHAGYEDFTLYTETSQGIFEKGWIVEGKDDPEGTYHSFNVTSGSFTLPADVVLAGYAFVGWERVGGTEAIPDVFDPKTLAAKPNLKNQKFRPVFVEKRYEVTFLPNHAEGHARGTERAAIVDFEGTILDPGDFEGMTGYEIGATLRMAEVPDPDATATDKTHTSADAAEPHYHSYPFSAWQVGNDYDPPRDAALQRYSANQTVAPARWSELIYSFVEPEPGSASGTEVLPVYAMWSSVISAVLPLQAHIALDTQNGSVALPDEAYRAYGIGLNDGEKLEIAALRYESLASNGTAGESALLVEGAPIRLTLFTDVAAKPEMGKPTLDENSLVRGDYGKEVANRLTIDLVRESATLSKNDLAGYGFRPFTYENDKLPMWFGLDLNGVHIDHVRALKEKLPDPASALDANAWTQQSTPVARLCYTVQLAK